MKRIFFILLISSSYFLHAQAYQKMLSGNVTTFNVVNLGKLAKPGAQVINLIPCLTPTVAADAGVWQVYGDTLWNGYTYKHVFGNWALAGIMREDTLAKKVYFLPTCSTNEVLLYDFSLVQGDTISYNLPFATAGSLTGGVFTVDSIKILHDYNIFWHRHFYLTNHTGGPGVLEMIEGVGNANHPLFLYYWFTDGLLKQWSQSLCSPEIAFSEVLACKADDTTRVYYDSVAFFLANGGQKTYGLNIVDSCYYSSFCCTAGMQSFTNVTDVSVYPNPTNDFVNCKTETNSDTELNFTLTNSLGEEIKKYPKQKLQKGTNETLLNLKDIPTGIYFLRISNGGFYFRTTISVQR